LTIEVDAPTNLETDAARKLSPKDEKARKSKEKERKQHEFTANCALADVLVDEANAASLKCSSKTAHLQSIKGVSPNLLVHNALWHFMTMNRSGTTTGTSPKA
jgi:hypothetical protein